MLHRDELTLRQQALLVRSAQLRSELADQLQIYKKPLAIVDQARMALDWLYKNPAWPLGGLLVLVILRPGCSIRWGGRVWWAWRTFKQARQWLARQPRLD